MTLLTAEGRRAGALILMAIFALLMTMYAAWAMYLVADRARFVFYLGETAMLLIAIVLTGFAGLLVKRSIKASGFGANFEATDQGSAADGAAVVAGAAVDAAAQVTGDTK